MEDRRERKREGRQGEIGIKRREIQRYLQNFQKQCEVHYLEFCLNFIIFVEPKHES